MTMGINLAVAIVLSLLSTQASAQKSASSISPTATSDISLVEAKDLNPDPAIVEINLTARVAKVEVASGKVVTAWTYDGGLPGPLIRARVGDRLIVHFKNELPEPTTVHWHGVRVPIEMDGVPVISQPNVETGGTFTYDFTLRDASLYWYHPHVASAAQVGFGLYGALLVEDPADGVGVADQLTMVLSDIGFDKSGTPEPADSGGAAGMVFGREGAYLLVNGKIFPHLRARAGALQRWRIVNTAKSRFFYLEMDGQPFVKIGSDGGLQEKSETLQDVLVTPGERVDLLVAPSGKPNTSLVVRATLYNRGYGSVEYRSVEDLFSVDFTAEPALPRQTFPTVSRQITPPRGDNATPISLVLTLPPKDASGRSEFRINGVPYWKAKPYRAALGETQLWTIKNESKWDHPMHLHGYFFMRVDEKGEPVRPLQWKDTMNVAMESTARFLVTFDERPGQWMFHCHILDHAEGGLMGTIVVGDGPTRDHIHVKQP